MDMMNIEELFQWFLNAWDEDWSRKLTSNIDGKKKEWAESLAGKSREELLQAFRKAKAAHDRPPTIKQFIELCSKSQVVEGWNNAKAAELADNKLKRVMPTKYAEIEMVRDIFKHLQHMIYETRSDDCDFAVCKIEGCCHFEVFAKQNLSAWLCKKHDGSYND